MRPSVHERRPGRERSIFLNFLIPRLPFPQEEDLSKGILDAIDMDSYRVEKRAMQKILLPDEDAEIDSVPTAGGGQVPEPELDRLSNILRTFNDRFGGHHLGRRRPRRRTHHQDHPFPGGLRMLRSGMPGRIPTTPTLASSTTRCSSRS